MDRDDNIEYLVGYRRPPRHTQFKKGQSGNPKGRPKISKCPNETLVNELFSTIEIKENGKTKKITKLDAIYKRVTNMALSGDMKAINTLLKLLPDIPFEKILAEERNIPLKPPSPAMQEIKALIRETIQDKINAGELE